MKRTLQLASPLMRGDDVAYARRLLELHDSPDVFDETAAAAARAAKWELGYADRNCTGTFGTALEKYILGRSKPTPAMRLRARARRRKDIGSLAVAEARKWLGTTEHPAGTNIAKPFTPWYLGTSSWGCAWCAIFVSWCLDKAGQKNVKRGQRWAYCPYFLADARAGRYGLKVVTAQQVVEGTVVLFDWDNDGVADHIGFATGPVNLATGSVPTIEGNTSSSSSGDQSNGGMVATKTRYLGDIIAFVKVA